MARHDHLDIYKSSYVFIRELMKMRHKMPKTLKYDLGEKCLDSGFNCIRKIIEANSQVDKKQTLKELSTEIDV